MLVVSIVGLVVALASAAVAAWSAASARASVDHAERSADAAQASAAEARRSADAAEGTLAVERERLEQERKQWDEQEAPKWEVPGVLRTEGDGFVMGLTNIGPDATVESAIATHPLGTSIGLLRQVSDSVESEDGSIGVKAHDSVLVRFPDPQAFAVGAEGHRVEVTISAMSSMRGTRSTLVLTMLGMGKDHTGSFFWKPNTWRPA